MVGTFGAALAHSSSNGVAGNASPSWHEEQKRTTESLYQTRPKVGKKQRRSIVLPNGGAAFQRKNSSPGPARPSLTGKARRGDTLQGGRNQLSGLARTGNSRTLTSINLKDFHNSSKKASLVLPSSPQLPVASKKRLQYNSNLARGPPSRMTKGKSGASIAQPGAMGSFAEPSLGPSVGKSSSFRKDRVDAVAFLHSTTGQKTKKQILNATTNCMSKLSQALNSNMKVKQKVVHTSKKPKLQNTSNNESSAGKGPSH